MHRKYLLVIPLLFIPLMADAEGRYEGKMIDAYTAIEPSMEDPSIIIGWMNKARVDKTILGSKLKSWQTVEKLGTDHPSKIIPALKVINKAYLKGEADKHARVVTRWDENYQYPAMGESFLYLPKASLIAHEFNIRPDHEMNEFLTNLAGSSKRPLILHISFGQMSPKLYASWMQDFKDYLQRHEDTTIILGKLGQLKIEVIQSLLKDHENLYLTLAHTTLDYQDGDQNWTIIFNQNGLLLPEWKTLLADYSDRFLFSTYSYSALEWSEIYPEVVDFWRLALGTLPRAAAVNIAYRNAQRLWHLN